MMQSLKLHFVHNLAVSLSSNHNDYIIIYVYLQIEPHQKENDGSFHVNKFKVKTAKDQER